MTTSTSPSPTSSARSTWRTSSAGSDLIETNTFSANRYKLARFGLDAQVAEINRRGVQLARELAGDKAFVAGAVGPLPGGLTDVSIEELPEADARAAFREQITALADAGADLILLETFTELDQLRLALDECRKCCDLPVMAQMTFPDGQHAPDGSDAFEALESLHLAGANVIGTNCGQGVAKVLKAIEYLGQRTNAYLSAFANAGLPQRVGGRMLYLAEARVHRRIGRADGRGRGQPRRRLLRHHRPRHRRHRRTTSAACKPGRRQVSTPIRPAAIEAAATPPRAIPNFLARLKTKPVVLVELDAPRNTDVQKFIRSVKQLQQAGADAVTIGDSPLATMRMNGFMLASLVARECDIELICHLACRDRNLIATQGLLLGADALGHPQRPGHHRRPGQARRLPRRHQRLRLQQLQARRADRASSTPAPASPASRWANPPASPSASPTTPTSATSTSRSSAWRRRSSAAPSSP